MEKKKNGIYINVSSRLLGFLLILFAQECVFGAQWILTLEDMKIVKGGGCTVDSVAVNQMGCSGYDCGWCYYSQGSCTGGGGWKCLGTDFYKTGCNQPQTTQGCQDYIQDCGTEKKSTCVVVGESCESVWSDTGYNCARNAKQTVSSCQ